MERGWHRSTGVQYYLWSVELHLLQSVRQTSDSPLISTSSALEFFDYWSLNKPVVNSSRGSNKGWPPKIPKPQEHKVWISFPCLNTYTIVHKIFPTHQIPITHPIWLQKVLFTPSFPSNSTSRPSEFSHLHGRFYFIKGIIVCFNYSNRFSVKIEEKLLNHSVHK